MEASLNPRYSLAAARIALRACEDGEATLRAIIAGQAQGSNDVQRKASAAELLLHSDDYQDALRELRAAQAQVDHAQAAVDIANDDLRRAELAARERLAEALMGRRADEATSDTTLRDALADAAERLFGIAEDMGCDAGNHDGGSSANCEHCRIIGHANHIERLLRPRTDNIDWYEVAQRAERSKYDAINELPF